MPFDEEEIGDMTTRTIAAWQRRFELGYEAYACAVQELLLFGTYPSEAPTENPG